MPLPVIITNKVLLDLASPFDTHEVHVIIRRIANQGGYTLRGRNRQYIVNYDEDRRAHILKVPLSLWMQGCSPGPVAENESVAYDIQSSRTALKAPLTFEVWPRAGVVAAKSTPDTSRLREFLTKLDAPAIVTEGLELWEAGDSAGLETLIASIDEVPVVAGQTPEKPKPLTNAERQKIFRERKKQSEAQPA